VVPAQFAALVVGEISESGRVLREGERHGRSRHLRVEALLQTLIPERGEVRRVGFAEHDLGPELLVRADLGTEVLGPHRIQVGEHRVPTVFGKGFLEGGQPGDAEGVVGKEHGGFLVGGHLAPHILKGGDQIFGAPEGVESPLEDRAEIGPARDQIVLPRTVGAQAGNTGSLGLVGDRAHVGAGRRGQDDVDLRVVDQIARYLGGAIRR